MTFLIKAKDGQSYWVHTEVGNGTTKVVVQPIESPDPADDADPLTRSRVRSLTQGD